MRNYEADIRLFFVRNHAVLFRLFLFVFFTFSLVFLSLKYSFADDFTVTDLGDYGNVTVMEVTGNYDANKPDGTINAEPRQSIAREFYKTHKDEYDFLVIFTNFDLQFPEADAKAFYMGVRNDVQGLGIELFDYSSLFGSSGKLQGTIDMGNISNLVADPVDPGFEETLSTLAHEQMHRWGAHLRFRDANGNISTDLLGKDSAHWSFLLNSYGSVLYGNYWQDNGNGAFTSIGASKYYSPLDLYLMGFNDKTHVPPMLLIDNPEINRERLPETGATISGSPRSVTMDDITIVEGERAPGAAESQKSFRTAFIFITEPGTFAGDEIYGIENIRNGWVTRYSVLTDGKGIMQVAPILKDNPPLNPGVFPPPADPRTQSPDIVDGVAWLMSNQNTDGSWTDSYFTADRDTAAVATTLIHFPLAEEQSSLGAQWLNSRDPENVDYLSRKITALAGSGQDVSGPVARLISGQNPDGGWGGSNAYTSNPVDTSLALKAFALTRYSKQSVLSPAIEYLKARQHTDGGWGGDDGVSSVETTANVLSAFNQYLSAFQLEVHITNAIAWMTQRQNTDGGFVRSANSEEGPSTVYDTAIAVLTLRGFNTSPDVTNNGMDYLLGQQSENGSWNSSVYDTALAVDAVWKATVDPDLSVSADDITFIPSSVNALPSNIVISATLSNLGRTDVPQTKAALYDGPVSEGNKISEQIVAFPGLSSVNVTFSVFVIDGNEHRFSVALDPEYLIDEPNESNNTAMKILFPQTTYDFEILPQDITVSSNPADIFQDVSITSRISNKGTMNAYNVQVKYSAEDPEGSFDIGTSTIDIPAGETVTNEINWRADRAGEDIPLSVSVDPLNTYQETSEENNRAVSLLSVNGSTDPNLTISYEDITISSDPAKQGGDTNISALIRNEGFSTASDIQVNFYRGTPDADGLLIGSRVIPSLNAGASVTVSADWTGIMESGEKIISVKIDSDNRVKEIREDDNDAFTTLKILSLPDLSVSTNSIDFSPPAPKEGEMVSVTVMVQNRGEQDASNVTVNAYEGDMLIGTQVISMLQGNSQASTSFTYDTTGKTGAHKITVVADPDHTIIEQTERNNLASRTFGVQDANLWLTEQYISPDGDGVKDSTEFFFRITAPQTVNIAVVNGKGETVRTFSGTEFENMVSGNITWDGLNDEGMVVDDGQYRINIVDLNNRTLGSLLVVVDTNRSSLTEAIGTKYLLNTNLSCMLPDINDWQWLPDENGIFFNIQSVNPDAPEYQKGLYTMGADGQDILSVSPSGGNVYSYALSPDGDRFAFTSGNKLWMTNIDGSNTQLLDEVDAAYSILDARWSPDSRYILYNLGQVYVSGNGAYELWIINTESMEKTKIDWGYLTTWLTAEWSPDSQEIAYFVIPPDGSCIDDLKVYNVSGEKRTIATFDYCEWYTPIYWLDNRKIMPLHPSLGSELWLYDSGGNGEKTELTGGSGFEYGFSPAPDNISIAFITSTGKRRQLKIADADGNVSVLHELEAASTSCAPDLYNIVWSPDSSKMVFLETIGTYGGSLYPCSEAFPLRIVVLDLETNTKDVMPADSLTLIRWFSDNHSIIGYRYEKNYRREICAADIGKKSITTIASDLYLPDPEDKLLSPLERYITFHKNTEQSGVCYGRGYQDLWAVSSAMNLIADFSVVKEKSSIVLKGTAADLHFEGYTLEYADTNTPDTWHSISPPSDIPVMNDVFTAWIPPYEGSLYVRLTVRDKAGNVAVKRKRISWGYSSSLTNLYKSREIFSPNNDGVGDIVELHYKVLEPVHLEFTILDAGNTVIRTINRDYPAPADDYITWDGRDSRGNIVTDGKYSIKVFDYEFFVEVDNTPPDVGIHLTDLIQDFDITTNTGTGQIYTELSGHAVDANLKNWVIEYGAGDNLSEWYPYISGEDLLAAMDENGDPVNPVQDEEIADYREAGIESLVGKKLRITAGDFAGNRSSQVTGSLEEKLILSNDLWQPDASGGGGGYEIFILAKPDELYPDLAIPEVHHLGGLETIRLPLASMNVQYYSNRQWSDIPPVVTPASGLIDLVWDNSSGSEEIHAVRIKATDITGQTHYSNEILATSLFSINPCNLTAFNALFEELTLLKFQVRNDEDSRYAQWTDFLVFDLSMGQSIPSGLFSVSGALPTLQNGLQYKIKMIGTGTSGTYYESIADYPAAGCQDQEPLPVPLRFELEVDYSEADCGLTADGIATLRAYLSGYQDDMALKSLSYYLHKPEGDQLVQRFSLAGGTLSDAIVDTISLPEGSYPVKAILSYLDNRKNETIELTAANTLVVDRVLPTSRLTYPDVSSQICPVSVSDPKGDWRGIAVEGAATDNSRVKRYEMYYGPGKNPATWLPAMTRKYDAGKKAMVDSPIFVNGPKQGTLGVWNVDGLQQSNVSLKLKVIDAAGNASCSTTDFSIDNVIEISDLVRDKDLFSPNGDGLLDDVTIHYRIDEYSTVDVKVFHLSKDANGFSLPDTNPVRTIASGLQHTGSTEGATWDGRDDSGMIVPDGSYAILVSAEDSCGNATMKWIDTEADNSPPTAIITCPGPTDSLGNIIEVKGTADDIHFGNYILEAGKGTDPSEWAAIASNTNPVPDNILGLWNVSGLDGIWTIRLAAFDSVGNLSTTSVTVDLGERKNIIQDLQTVPRIFSPNNDGKIDTAVIHYSLTDSCQVMIAVSDETGTVSKTYSTVVPSAGAYNFAWNGSDNSGAIVPDGSYTIRLSAAFSSNPSVTQDESVTLIVDSIPPTLDIKQPLSSSYYKDDLAVTGSIIDPNLLEYSISYSGNEGTVLINKANQSKENHIFGVLNGLSEGSYLLNIYAKDIGENVAEEHIAFTIDRTPPKVVLDLPVEGEMYGSGRNAITVNGSIIERNLDVFRLQYGAGDNPSQWTTLLNGTAIPDGPQLFSWNVGKSGGIADGLYTLSLSARDKAGLTGETRVKITIDNTPPEVSITSPPTGGYARAPLDIKGTASDANLEKYILESSEGPCSSAFRWGLLNASVHSVKDGMLALWQVLPSDGEYCLRLTATDKIGNTAETKSDLKVDTHPPATPLLSGTIENGSNVTLSWTAGSEPDISGYDLYRNGAKINTALIKTTTYSDHDMKEGIYDYTLKAIDFAGNESDFSNEVKLRIDITGPDAKIRSPLNDTSVSGIVEIKGTAYSSDDFRQYRLYIAQGQNPAAWDLIRTSPVPISYGILAQWDTLGLQGLYSLKLEAEDISGNITTHLIAITVDDTAPAPPVLISAIPDNSDVAITWQSNTEPDLAGYLLYRNNQLVNVSGMVTGNLRPYLISGTIYPDKALPDGTFRYYLIAMDQAGNMSGQSNTVEVDLDTHPPHATIIEPANASSFDSILRIRAESTDLDTATVQFQYKRSQDSVWINLNNPVIQTPYITTMEPLSAGLTYSTYHLRAIATDNGGKTDPAPSFITVTYTDITAPAAPYNLHALTNGKEVTLTWTANDEADLDGYNIYRTSGTFKTKVNPAVIKDTSYQENNLSDGVYTYEVTAIDSLSNESEPSNSASAKVYIPVIVQPYTPTGEKTIPVSGGNADAGSSVEMYIETLAGPELQRTVSADAAGNFAGNIALQSGENRIMVKARDCPGNISRTSDSVIVVYNDPPSSPIGLMASSQDFSVSLTWNPNAEPDLSGYNLFRDGEKVNISTNITSGIITVSSNDYDSLPANAFDGDPSTYWMSRYSYGVFTPEWWEIDLPSQELISHIEIHWESDSYAGKDYEVQVWSGYAWITQVSVTGNASTDNSFDFNPSYRTDKIRIYMTDSTNTDSYKQVSISEIKILKDNLIAQPSYQDAELHDGNYAYRVTAVDYYGFESPPSEDTVAMVGNVTPPAVPLDLRATASGPDVTLNWLSNTEPDLAGYNVFISTAQGWMKLNPSLILNTTFTDASLPNGTYTYRVTAVDTFGNESLPSNEAIVQVSIVLPETPFSLHADPLPEGKALSVFWEFLNSSPSGYNLYRSAASGGPYEKMNEVLLNTNTYIDTGLTNGSAYYYVVTAVDAVGNESAHSNEAMGVPSDTTTPTRPQIFYPTIPAAPVISYQETADVSGIAEPASTVQLFREGISEGTTMPLEKDMLNNFPLDSSVYTAALSPDGMVLAYVYQSSLWLKDLETGETTQIIQKGTSPSWAPDGRKLAYILYDTNNYPRIGIYDVETGTDEPLTDDANISEYSPSWSSDGTIIAFRSNTGGLWDAWIKDLETGSLTQVTDGLSLSDGKLSPDGKKLAYFKSQELSVIYLTNNTTGRIDSMTDGHSLDWSPDSRKLAFISRRTGNSNLFVLDTNTHEQLQLTDSTEYMFGPVWSPDGNSLALGRSVNNGYSVWLMDARATESGRILKQNLSYISYLDWVRSGALAVLDPGLFHIAYSAGYFNFSDVWLEPGENIFSAVAADLSGNTSGPSEEISVIYDTSMMPDLEISEDDIFLNPPYPKPGEETAIHIVVRSRGPVEVKGAQAEIYLMDSSGNTELLKSQTLSALGAGSEETLWLNWTASDPEKYTIIAVLDSGDDIPELLETNNLAMKGFFVSGAEGIQMMTTLDSNTYRAGQDAGIRINLMNSGIEKDVTILTSIEDEKGNTVSTLNTVNIHLPYASEQDLDLLWNTGMTYSGSYMVRTLLQDASGLLDEKSVPFDIEPDITIELHTVTDRTEYNMNEDIRISTNVRNNGKNYIVPELKVMIQITDAYNNILFNEEKNITNLLPGISTSLNDIWNSDLYPSGDYHATAEVYSDGGLISRQSVSFRIRASFIITGNLAVAPSAVSAGNTAGANYSIHNTGNTEIDGLIVRLLIIDPETLSILDTHEESMNMGMNATAEQEFVFSTQDYAPRAYEILLQYLCQGTTGTIATAFFTVQDGTPLVISDTITDKTTYKINETAHVISHIRNVSANSVYNNLTAHVSILNNEGQPIFTEEKPIQDLIPGQLVEINTFWDISVHPKGIYTVKLEIFEEAKITSRSTFAFEILGSSETGEGLSGLISSGSDPVFQGKDETLTYNMTNNGNEDISVLSVKVSVVDPDTQEEVTEFNTQFTVKRGETVTGVHAVSTMPFVPGTYSAVLQVATDLMPGPKILGSTTFEVKPAVGVIKNRAEVTNLLVWVNDRCRNNQGKHARCIDHDRICVREDLLEEILKEAANNYHIVYDKKDFETEQRNPLYTDTIILGDNQPVEGHFFDETREQVYSGRGIISSLYLKPREWGNAYEDSLFGLRLKGDLPGDEHIVRLDESLISGYDSLYVRGKAVKVAADNSTSIAGWINSEKGYHGTFRQEQYPALILNEYGTGKAVYYAFDLGLTLNEYNYDQLSSIIKNSLGNIHKPSVAIRVFPNQLIPLEIELKSIGGDNDLRLTETYPPEIKIYDPSNRQWITDNPWVVIMHLQADETKNILYYALMPDKPMTYTLETEAGYINNGTYFPYQNLTTDLVLDRDEAMMMNEIIAALERLSGGSYSERMKIRDAIRHIGHVQDRGSGSYENIEKNISDLLGAIDSLSSIAGADVPAIRLMIDRLLRSLQSRYYLNKFMQFPGK